MLYQSQYPGKLVMPSGDELSLGDAIDADPENLGIQMAIADGWLVEVLMEPEPEPDAEPEPAPVAAKGKKE
ncbi:MAG: hypothetical protein ACRCYS_17290 [Beijerinckiaceae bacterium]